MNNLYAAAAACAAASLAACGGDGVEAAQNVAAVHAMAAPPASTATPRASTTTPSAAAVPSLSSPADTNATGIVRKAAVAFRDVTIDTSQSFDIMMGRTRAATIVAGEGTMADATNAGCFVALVQGGTATILPTIGIGSWEAETCLKTEALGIVGSKDSVRIGVVYKAASPNAEMLEPVVLRWMVDTSGSFSLDDASSRRASAAGVTSIAGLRRLLR